MVDDVIVLIEQQQGYERFQKGRSAEEGGVVPSLFPIKRIVWKPVKCKTQKQDSNAQRYEPVGEE